MKKALSILLVVLMAVGAVFAQGAGETSTASKGSVYWLNFKPESDAVLQEVAAAYTAETGVPVQVFPLLPVHIIRHLQLRWTSPILLHSSS